MTSFSSYSLKGGHGYRLINVYWKPLPRVACGGPSSPRFVTEFPSNGSAASAHTEFRVWSNLTTARRRAVGGGPPPVFRRDRC